jgi:ribose/xylose/arabinose/galactoside ABC-type transport system permease subunit
VLILDEPTRGVDVGSKAEIHALIRRVAEEGRAVVLISSDLPEVLVQSDRVAVFREGRVSAIVDPCAVSAEDIAAAALPEHGKGESGQRESGDLRRAQESSGAAHSLFSFSLFREAALVVALVVLVAFVQLRTGQFLQAGTVRNLLVDASLLSIVAVGAAVVILAGGLDISLGALMVLSAGIAGDLWQHGKPLPIVIGVAAAIGVAGGLLNAGLSLIGRVHPIVVTLGTMSLYRGLALWWLGEDVQIPLEHRSGIVTEMLGLPLIVWGSAALVAVLWSALNFHVYGRQMYAVGGNSSAARRVGIRPAAVWLKAFALQGLLAGLAGLLNLARSGSLQPTSYEDQTLKAIAAVVIGGVAITGGRGSIWGVALGCVFLVTLNSACTFLRIAAPWQLALVGAVLVVAVSVDNLWRAREA